MHKREQACEAAQVASWNYKSDRGVVAGDVDSRPATAILETAIAMGFAFCRFRAGSVGPCGPMMALQLRLQVPIQLKSASTTRSEISKYCVHAAAPSPAKTLSRLSHCRHINTFFQLGTKFLQVHPNRRQVSMSDHPPVNRGETKPRKLARAPSALVWKIRHRDQRFSPKPHG
jgi:hypothetical protein